MKSKRQEALLEIIEKKIILTQEELQSELNAMGFNVTQSTVSRDIKELRLIKAHDSAGNYRYIVSDRAGEQQPLSHYSEIISNSIRAIEYAVNDIVIKCYNGMAQSVCVAIDLLFGDRMLGSVAGDDTILIITHSEEEAVALTREIRKMI